MAQPYFLSNTDLQLILFGGKGGVGKTTCATATALHLARIFPEHSFLLVSTDPAHSLADSLAGFPPPDNLKILEFDAQESLEAFKAEHNQKLREIASRGTFLDDEDINQFLDLSLPGMDELLAFLEISSWVEDRSYDCIIVDTAPTGHTLRLLSMPELLRKWLEALDALLAKHRYMKKLFAGAYRRDDLDFFLEKLSLSVKKIEILLRDPVRCRFVPVMLAEALSISETDRLVDELERLKVPLTDIVINRLYPESTCPVCADGRTHQMRELKNLFGHRNLSGYLFWGIPVYPVEVRGIESLDMFWGSVEKLTEETPIDPKTSVDLAPWVTAAAPYPSPETTLLLFAGKGGVGKTTLACATAVRLAHDLKGKQVLLFSTDPAHSLSACLDVPIGPKPTRLSPGLTAMEIDAQAEFDSLKMQYQKELGRFLESVLPNLDFTFDREVMEKILDLSPPGLDEVMALTRIMEFLAQGNYSVFILDSAPTGHLIRFLELPELIDQWLRVFFGLFLKYKRVFRLPKISQRLVQMSKDLKHLRTLLKDPSRSALYAVSILTEMALQETQDLVEACDRMGISTPVLFLNLATSASECPLCSALGLQEAQVKEKFRQQFPGKHQTIIYRQAEPRGREQLEKLGQSLYAPVGERWMPVGRHKGKTQSIRPPQWKNGKIYA
ncbi:MAG: ArsA family ATPase [Proteobacteria bacterium]|nr:ArsA family ATPase [Pseudomonadota bacterium]